ncbi:uncharacterized protein LOC111373255 [Olea europaea var. sylvestris]|uniref:uncharacterized protein LOC111373255 n=1 Tax=Olea europaea var. sylvestris TaxID=158386 RepID=UPI000C1CD0C3|nr:uncharacterized protein LOC111373255 [Olea europaea var. sylvestris]
MKCKNHAADLSSAVGVCASCLQERLVALIAAQAEKEAQEGRRNFDTQPAPPAFPRSVSPYVSRRKFDDATTWHLRCSSPQVAPASSVTVEVKKNSGGRFSLLFSGLFRSKTEQLDSDSGPISDPGVAGTASSPTILPARRKKQSRTLSLDNNVIEGHRRNYGNHNRGMSPARYSDEDESHFPGGLSGCSSESSQGWKQTPRRTPAMRRRGGFPGHCRNISGLAFCLSPLVRAGPNLHLHQKGSPQVTVVAGDSRIPAKPYLSNSSAFCKNRSRKLCRFGRFNPNN